MNHTTAQAEISFPVTTPISNKASKKTNFLKDTFNNVASVLYQHGNKIILFPILKYQLENGHIDHFEAASRIAHSVHRFAKRRDGKKYMHHVYEVVNGPDDFVEITYTPEQTKVAMTHDVSEDSRGAWKISTFRKLNFSEEFQAGQDGVTHRKGEPYLDFIERCGRTPGAPVKCVDNIRNWKNNPKPLREKLYRVSYHYLRAIILGKIEPGTNIVAFALKEGLYDKTLFAKYSSHPVVENYSPPSHKAHMQSITASSALGATPI